MEFKDEQLEAMLERLMRDEAIETPSDDFTDKVMDRVQTLANGSSITYRPLISKWVWVLIVLVFTGLIAIISLNSSGGGGEWLSRLNVSDFQFQLFENIHFEFSKTFTYGSILLGVMMLVQATMLKSYFNNRMSV